MAKGSSEEKPKRMVQSPGGFYGRECYEQIRLDSGSQLAYALYALDTGETRVREALDVDAETTHVPLDPCPWFLPRKPIDYGSEEDLYIDIRSFYEAHLDLANPELFDVLATFSMATWRSEAFNVVGYLMFLGPLDSGKTRALECLQRLSYRAWLAISPTPENVFHALDAFHPTLLLDELDKLGRDAMREITGLLNAGYRRGAYVPRLQPLEGGGYRQVWYDVFGFKALAGTKALLPTLGSRCIPFNMMRAVKPVPLSIDEEWASRIRSKLLMYRFRTIGKALPEVDLSRFSSSRVAELFLGLLQAAPTDNGKVNLMKVAEAIMFSREEEEKSSLEARIVKALLQVKDKVIQGRVSTGDVTETFNQGLSEKEQLSVRSMGWKLKALGLQRTRMPGHAGEPGWFWDDKLVSRLAKRYKLLEEEEGIGSPGKTSETSETTPSISASSLITAEIQPFSIKEGEKGEVAKPPSRGVVSVVSEVFPREAPPSVYQPIMVAVKSWCMAKRDEGGEISLLDLASFVKEELKYDPQHVIEYAFNNGILMPSPKLGKAVVM